MTAPRSLNGSVCEPMLYVAFELGAKSWKLGMTSGFGVAPWVKSVAAGDWVAIRRLLARARERWGVPATARGTSCYEAGRGGFWVQRALQRDGIANRGGASARIGGNRPAPRGGGGGAGSGEAGG